jgi:hypothetical protein
MSKHKQPLWGDLVSVRKGSEVVGQGVVQKCPDFNGQGSYDIDTTYGPGYSASGEPHLTGVAPDRVELVEEGWGQKWQKRAYGRQR